MRRFAPVAECLCHLAVTLGNPLRLYTALFHGTDNAVLRFLCLTTLRPFGGGALHAFVPQFFGKADAPFKQIILARVEPFAHIVLHQHAQVDVRMRRFAFPLGFMVQGKGILVIWELFGGKFACGVLDGFRRRACGHGQHDV